MIFCFKLLLTNLRGGKGGTFMVGPGRHLGPLHHCCRSYVNVVIVSLIHVIEATHSIQNDFY